MKYAAYHKNIMVDGEGVRHSLYVSGCPFRCLGCYNEKAQNHEFGTDYTPDFEEEIIKDLKPKHIKGLSLLGGDPFSPKNIDVVTNLATKVKEEGNKDIWAWTGFEYEQIIKNSKMKTLLEKLDFIVDGKFEQDKFYPGLTFRGSYNQRIIDVKKSLEAKKAILYKNGSYLDIDKETIKTFERGGNKK